MVALTPRIAQDTNVVLSPAQIARLESWEARFPVTYFDITAQDIWSCAIVVEIEDMETCTTALICANGRFRLDI